jgi:large subunit ribosomal protein L24e
LKWTKAFRKAHGKELVVDSTFEFERIRHRPIKYNRELMGKTIQAMQRIAQIKARREQRFWEERMKEKKRKEKAEALRDLQQNVELLKPAQLSVERKTQLVQARVEKAKNAIERAQAKAAKKAAEEAQDIEE